MMCEYLLHDGKCQPTFFYNVALAIKLIVKYKLPSFPLTPVYVHASLAAYINSFHLYVSVLAYYCRAQRGQGAI